MDVAARIAALQSDYASCLDDDRLEEWPDFFCQEGSYEILTRENRGLGYDQPIYSCSNKRMMVDRIVALRRTTIYNLHYDRHILSGPRVSVEQPTLFRCKQSFVVFQTSLHGRTVPFICGEYDDRITVINGMYKFLTKVATIDTFSVPNMIAVPL